MIELPVCEHRGRIFSGDKVACRHPDITGPQKKSRPVPASLCLRCPHAGGGSVCPATPVAPSSGPGTELTSILAALGVPGCQQCHELAGRMNQWGADACRKRMAEIVDDILPRARQWLVHRLTTRLIQLVPDAVLRWMIRRYVHTAITRSETTKETAA